MKELLYVFLGGGVGSVLRYMASMYWRHLCLDPRYAQMTLPWPTLVVNVVGCALIAAFYQYSERWGLDYETRLLLTTGLCGGLTTFSTFSYEGISLLREGNYTTYALYLSLTIVLGLAVMIPFFMCNNVQQTS